MSTHPALALYQPDIPQNAGTILRLGACLGIDIHIIGPTGFRLDDRALKRAGLDYLDMASLHAHVDWQAFEVWAKTEGRRLVLATTGAATPYTQFEFSTRDVVLLGRESAGAPDKVHQAVAARLLIPMRQGLRSLNIAVAAAMLAGEALRQTGSFPAVQSQLL